MELSTFKQILFGVAREVEAVLGHVIVPNVTPNFLACRIDTTDGFLYIICSENGDWAFVDDYQIDVCELSFVDNELIASTLRKSFNIQVHSKEYLCSPLISTDSMLDADLKYWRPQTTGEGLFHWWD